MSEKLDEAVSAAYAAIDYSIPPEMVESAIRAALAVLREPSDEMVSAAYLPGDSEWRGGVDRTQARHAWGAMIDAALTP